MRLRFGIVEAFAYLTFLAVHQGLLAEAAFAREEDAVEHRRVGGGVPQGENFAYAAAKISNE